MQSLSRGFIKYCFLSVVYPALTLVLVSESAFAQVPVRAYDATLKQMFDAIQSKSYDRFVADGDAKFKAGFTPKMFEDLARQLGPKLERGYQVGFLTTLNQQDFVVYVWKLAFKGGKDDFLVTLFIKDGNVTGFVIR